MRAIRPPWPAVLLVFALAPGCSTPPRAEPTPGKAGGPGVRLKADAVVYAGSPVFCSCPAVFDYNRVREATPEWRTIRDENVRPGSARHALLTAAMHERIVNCAQALARRTGNDLIVRRGDIDTDNGLEVADVTAEMLRG